MNEVNEAVILLGGMGTRMLPYTKSVPKEMLPIYDVPNIFLIVKEAYLSGIKRIIFVVTEHNHDIIKKFFSKDKYLDKFLKDKPDKQILLKELNEIITNLKFTFVLQKLKGTYGALYTAKDYLKNDNFIVMYGDDLIDTKIPLTKQLINSFQKNHSQQIALYESIDKLPPSGIAVLNSNNYLTNLVPSNETNSKLVVHGRMLLNKKVFELKNKLVKHDNDEYYLPHALLEFKDVYGYVYEGNYFNIGERTGFIKASIYFALKQENIKKDLIEYIEKIKENYE